MSEVNADISFNSTKATLIETDKPVQHNAAGHLQYETNQRDGRGYIGMTDASWAQHGTLTNDYSLINSYLSQLNALFDSISNRADGMLLIACNSTVAWM